MIPQTKQRKKLMKENLAEHDVDFVWRWRTEIERIGDIKN
jgi:hypothetical protein